MKSEMSAVNMPLVEGEAPSFCHNFIKYLPMFKISSTVSSNFTIKWLLKIPPHFTCVATLPCENAVSFDER